MTESHREPYGGMTPEEMDALVERAATRALEKVYAEVGQSVLKKLAWLVGTVSIGLALWLTGKNVLPLK